MVWRLGRNLGRNLWLQTCPFNLSFIMNSEINWRAQKDDSKWATLKNNTSKKYLYARDNQFSYSDHAEGYITSSIQCITKISDLCYVRKMTLKNMISNNLLNSSIHYQVIKCKQKGKPRLLTHVNNFHWNLVYSIDRI